MKSVIFLLLISSLLIPLSEAAGYTDKNGNPAPNPCKNGENVYFDTLIFNCVDGKKVFFGCKVNNTEVQQDTVKNENNLRTLHCHKDGNIVKTIVTGCITDDDQFINETKTVKQGDGTEFSCTKETNGFSYVKRSLTKVSQCVKNETKIIGDRYLLECYEESPGYFTFKLAACFSILDDVKSRIEVNKTFDNYVTQDKQIGFRYLCHAVGNRFYFEPIECLLSGQNITAGNIYQNGAMTITCFRENPLRLRLRPVYFSSQNENKTICTEAKTYVESSFKYECRQGQLPKPVGCIFFKNQKEIPINGTYDDEHVYQYKCEQSADNNTLALIKVACLDDKNQILVEGGTKMLADGSQIECQENHNDGLLRVIVSGKPPVEQCKEGEKIVQEYLQYECMGQKLKPIACAPHNNNTLIVKPGETYNGYNYQFKCEEQNKELIYQAVACVDMTKTYLMPGETRQDKTSFVRQCKRKANNELVFVFTNWEYMCKQPLWYNTTWMLMAKYYTFTEFNRTIDNVEYKSLSQCLYGGRYYLSDIGCVVDGKKYEIGKFVVQQQEAYKCVRPMVGEMHLIKVPNDQINCRYANKVYKNGDEFKSPDGISQYQCIAGEIVKTGCFVDDKQIPVNQVLYSNNEPFFCPEKGEGVIQIPFRGCYLKNGTLIKIGQNYNESVIQYTCTYTKIKNIFKPVIIGIGCVHQDQIIPLSGYAYYQNKKMICKVDNRFTVSVIPATLGHDYCTNLSKTYNCEYTQIVDGEGSVANMPPTKMEFAALPDTVNQKNGTGSTKPGSGNNIGNQITTFAPVKEITATSGYGENTNNGQQSGTTKGGNGGNSENEFPPDDEVQATTPIGTSFTRESSHTATGGQGNHEQNASIGGTTKSSNGNNNEQGFPTDEQGNPVTQPGHHTATGGSEAHHPGHSGQQSTQSSGGNNQEQPLPTDISGNPVTNSGDHTSAGGSGSNNPDNSNSGTTKTSSGNNNENPFPTDESGNTVTKPFNHNSTGDDGNNNPNNVTSTPVSRRTCNTTKVVTAGLWGDPHFWTFDGSAYSYHGTCPHVFLRPCTSIKGFENFSVKVKSVRFPTLFKDKAGFESTNIEIYGQKIYADASKVYINEIQSGFPYYYPSKENPLITVEKQSIWKTIIKTVDGIDFTISSYMVDKATNITDFYVSIPDCPEFFGINILCGMAGNYDGNCTNDVLYKNGTTVNLERNLTVVCRDATSSIPANQHLINTWGDDWITEDYFIPSSKSSSECFKGAEANVSSVCPDGEATCKPIKDAVNGTGIFAQCQILSAAAIIAKYDGCVADVCVDPTLKCQALTVFVNVCQRQLNGTKLSDWRESLACPMQCPANTIYNTCIPNCQPSCTDQLAINCSSLKMPCIEGCQCNAGFVQDQSKQPYRCIKQSDCSPIPTTSGDTVGTTSIKTLTQRPGINTPNGPGIPDIPGQITTTSPSVHDESTSTPVIRTTCNATKFVNARLYGDPHYWTFDIGLYSYHGTCPYIFVKPCTSIIGLENFSVKVKNHRLIPTENYHNSSAFESANIEIYGQKIYIDYVGKLYVNEVATRFPYYYPSQKNPKISIERKTQEYATIKTVDQIDFKVQLHNTSASFDVSIPDCPEFFGPDKLCGLAGNYDKNYTNDVIFRNGTETNLLLNYTERHPLLQHRVNIWGDDWITDDYFIPSLNGSLECFKGAETNFSSNCEYGRRTCKPISDALNGTGIFAPCKTLEAPQIIGQFEGCVADVCVNPELKCEAFGTFVNLCQLQLNDSSLSDWRKSMECPKQCPANTTYNICVPNCQPSCTDPLAKNCNSSTPCVEGCQCSAGFVQDQSKQPYRCIKQSDCPLIPTTSSVNVGTTSFKTSSQGSGINTSNNPGVPDIPGQITTTNPSVHDESTSTPILRRTCNTTKFVSAGLQGDPHYWTFDMGHYSYHGTCPYIFIEPCSSISGVENFSVKVKNYRLIPTETHHNFSAFESANIEIYGQKIYIDYVRKLYINEIPTGFPYYYPSQKNPKISIEMKTQALAHIKTIDQIDFKVYFGYHGYSATFDVSIPDCPEFFGPDKLCGLAGNYDKNYTNDVIFRNGTETNLLLNRTEDHPLLQHHVNMWGDDWITEDYFIPNSNSSLECFKGVETNFSSNCEYGRRTCKPIIDSLNGTGVFAQCKTLAAPQLTGQFEGCVADICVNPELKCEAFGTFVNLCQSQLNGTQLSDWRKSMECPIQCPANTTYNICVPNCQPSCTDQLAKNCNSTTPCVEGCQCNAGFVQDQSKQPYRCIKQSDCLPIPTTSGVTDDTTSSKTSTQGPNTPNGPGIPDIPEQITKSTSNEQKRSTSAPLIRTTCNTTKFVNAGLWGDPHYWTFDLSKFSYHGTCPYIFIQPCTSINGLENFSVKVKNYRLIPTEKFHNSSAFESANIEIYGQKIYIDHVGKLYVNEVPAVFPYYYPSQKNPKISIERKNQAFATITTIDQIDFKLHLSDISATFDVYIPDCPEFFGPDKLCGLAGSFDKNYTNDALFRNRTETYLELNSTEGHPVRPPLIQHRVNMWGDDWITDDYFIPNSNGSSECFRGAETNYSSNCAHGRETCKPIMDALNGTGIFAPCRTVGTPQIIGQFEGCVADICVNPELKCEVFVTIVNLCQRQLNGTSLPDWRKSIECPMQCPANTTYNICVPNCQPSCTDQLAKNCNSTIPCFEGCQCSDGFVQDQSKQPYRCIKQSDCPPIPTVPETTIVPTSSIGNQTNPGSGGHTFNEPANPNLPEQSTTPVSTTPEKFPDMTSPATPSPGSEGSTPSGPNNPGNLNEPDQTDHPDSGHPSTTSPTLPLMCIDLLPKQICQQLQPFCLSHSFYKAASTLPNKDECNSLISQIENSTKGENHLLCTLQNLVTKGIYPEEVIKNISPVSIKKTIPLTTAIPNAKCIALEKECKSSTDPSACANYVSQCSNDFNAAVCKAPTDFTPTKEFYKSITSEIISKLCPQSCLVQECFNKDKKPGKSDINEFVVPELLGCLFA